MSLNFTTDTSTQLSYSSFPFYTPYDTVNIWSKLTSNTNFIYNTSTNGKVGINTTAPQGALEIVGYNNPYKVKFGTAASDGTPFGANRLYSNGLFRIMTTYNTDEIATFHRIDSYDSPNVATEYFSIRTTGINITGDIYATGNAGIGVSPSPTYKLNVNGSINSTSLYQNGTQIDFSSYATNTNLTNNYYNKTTTDSLLNAKQQAITTYTISAGATGGNIGFSTTTSTLTLGMPNNYTQNMSISNLITPTSFIYKGTELSTTLGNYSTTGNDTNYLKKTGGDMTGNINMNSTSVINFGQREDNNLIKLWTNGTDTYGFGINASVLRYNATAGASHKFYSGTTNTATINSSGNITATSFSGDGANITNVPYSTITSKPTNFQADWNTTIINKPTNFQADWTTTIINKPTYFPIDPTIYYNKTEINGLSTLTNFYNKTDSDGRYLKLAGGTMTGALTVPNITLGNGGKINVADDYHYIQISQATDTITIQEWGTISFNIGQTKAQKAYINSSGLTATAFYGDGANITNLTYGNITGKPTNFQADWTTTIINRPTYFPIDPTIYYNKTEINGLSTLTNFYNKTDSDGRYLKLAGGDMTGNINMNSTSVINFGQRADDNLIKLWTNGTDTYGFGINSAVLRYNTPTSCSHKFYSGTTNTATLDGSGNLTTAGYIDTKIISLTGADAFATEGSPYPVDTGNKSNTYIHFRNAGTANDWCYLRQIGGANAIKLAFDFHDDTDDARFCIRSVNSVASPDVATEVFTVDSGNVSCTGTLTANSFSGNGANITNLTYGNITGTPSIYTQTQSDNRYLQLSGGTMTGNINMTTASTYLNFGTRIDNFLIKLYGSEYGFGVNGYTLRYNADTAASHKFYSGATNTATIDSVGCMIVGNANTNPGIQLGSTNGHNWGVATQNTAFSGSASIGDMVLRSINKLILQSGSGGHALMINADNSITCSGALTLSGALNLTGLTSGNNPLYISSTNTTANNCIQIKNNSTYTAYIGIGGTNFGGNYQNNFFIESASGSIILNTNGRVSESVPNMIIDTSGNVGLGVLNPLAKLNIYGTTQLQPKISLTGIEYYTGTNTNADGIGLMLGVNRTNNRQLFICDTAKLTQNTTNSMIRMGVGGGDTFIDSMATDGATRLGLNLANSFYCQANTYGSMNKFLKFHGVAVADDRPTMEGLIFNEGATVGGTFAGDTFISGYWGVAVLLNSGGFANGIGGGNNGRSYIPGYSAFTINMRSATSQTTFDKNIFIVYPDGQVYIKNMVSLTATDNSYIKCGANANGYYLNVGSTSSASSTMYDAVSAGIWTSFAGGLHLNACTNNNNVYVNFYNTGGLFSVGGAVPAAKLHVGSGTASTGNILQKYYSVVLNDQSLIYQTLSDVCAIFDSSVWCKSKYSVSSDERIKKNIQDINDDSALQKILLIEPKTYEYIDKVERGNSIVYGFIAQQIKEVIPEAITIEKSIIPNIFKICNYENDIISIPEEDISKLKINDEIEIIIEDDNNKRLVKIIEINDIDNTIKINESLNIIKTQTEEEEIILPKIKECFVYGSKVDDFHTLDKNYIYTLNVCATQELYKLIQQQNLIIQQLQQRISILETR